MTPAERALLIATARLAACSGTPAYGLPGHVRQLADQVERETAHDRQRPPHAAAVARLQIYLDRQWVVQPVDTGMWCVVPKGHQGDDCLGLGPTPDAAIEDAIARQPSTPSRADHR